MNREALHKRTQLFLLMAVAFTMPFSVRLNSILVIVYAVNWLAEGKLVSRMLTVLTNRVNILLIVFFGIHVFSILLSENTREALALLERRLPLLAFPLLFYTSAVNTYFKQITIAFCSGVVLALTWCLFSAGIVFTGAHEYDVFFYHKLSSFAGINAVYLSAYTVLAIFLIAIELYNGKRGVWYAGALLFLGVCSILLSSKLMLFMLVAGILFFLYRSSRHGMKIKRLVLTGIFLIVTAILLIPVVRNRFMIEFSSNFNVLQQTHFTYDTHFTGTSLRLLIWRYSIELLNEENGWITGTGTGDFQDLLNNKYRNSGVYMGVPGSLDTGYQGYGPHNQYVEVLLYAGVTGLLVFLYLLFIQLRSAFRSKDQLHLFFLLLVMCFFLTESVISTNKGIVFYVFFSVIFQARNYFARLKV